MGEPVSGAARAGGTVSVTAVASLRHGGKLIRFPGQKDPSPSDGPESSPAPRDSERPPAEASDSNRPAGELHDEHDEFFVAGDEGRYEGGPALPVAPEPALLVPEHEDDPRHSVEPSPEQLERRDRMTKRVALLVGFMVASLVVGVVAQRMRRDGNEAIPTASATTPVEPVATKPAAPPDKPVVKEAPAQPIELPTMSAEPAPAAAPPEAPQATAPAVVAPLPEIPPPPREVAPVREVAPLPEPTLKREPAPVREPAPQRKAPVSAPIPAPKAAVPAAPRRPRAEPVAPRPEPTPAPRPPANNGVPPTASFPM
jgi:hypothetical protein